MKVKYLLLATISGAIVALDQLTKMYVITHFRLGEIKDVIPSFFDITYVRNKGAAFGVFATTAQQFREPFFLLVPFVALIVIILIIRGLNDSQKSQVFGLSFIFGGAIGNYLDRLRFKYVIDFLDFHYKEVYHWPAFNVADSAIVCGVGLLLLHMLIEKTHHSVPAKS
jgi:signal peptidase II